MVYDFCFLYFFGLGCLGMVAFRKFHKILCVIGGDGISPLGDDFKSLGVDMASSWYKSSFVIL